MDKQEAALTAWLNMVLVPAKATEEGPASRALAAGRTAAKARGLLWQLYSSDNAIIATMLKVEKRIDAGQLRLRDEVSHCAGRAEPAGYLYLSVFCIKVKCWKLEAQ